MSQALSFFQSDDVARSTGTAVESEGETDALRLTHFMPRNGACNRLKQKEFSRHRLAGVRFSDAFFGGPRCSETSEHVERLGFCHFRH